MDRAKFYAALRRRDSGVFGTALSQPQVDGTEALLNASARYGHTDPHHVANTLAQVYHETGGYMLPIKETVFASHKDKNPSDQTVINRLENAWRAGRLPWVKTPYWRDGWFGRGQIQLTHEENYRKMGQRLGVDLVGNRDLALDPKIGADIAVVGMAEGMFTGKKLADYRFPQALDAAWQNHPRRIVNGKDGTDATITGYHRAFLRAIEDAGGVPTADLSAPKPSPIEPPVRPVEPVPPVEPPPPTKPVWQSGEVIAAVVVILAMLAQVFGWELSAEQLEAIANELADLAPQIVAVIGAVVVIVRRLRAGARAILTWRQD